MEYIVKIEHNQDSLSNSTASELTAATSYFEEVISDKAKWYRCMFPDCSKTFRYKSEIKRHNSIHCDQRPYYCTFDGCHKSFKRLDVLETHLRVHSEIKPFICEFPGCCFRSKNKGSLHYHALKHKQTKEYTCSFPGCNKSFLTKACLNQHEKGFTCHVKIAAKKEEFDEPTKLIKMTPTNLGNNFFGKVVSEADETSTRINKLAYVFQTATNEKDVEETFKKLLEELQKEKKLLTKALEIRLESMIHLHNLNKYLFQ